MEEKTPPFYSDGIPPVHSDQPEETFFLCIQAAPLPGSEDFGVAGGAFVNCYVDADDLRSAERRAIELIRQNGWQPRRFESWKLTSEGQNDVPGEEDGSTARELITQAREDGEACVFYCWPIDAPDADDPDV